MAFRFRKSKKIGPFRVTASKSGLGVSAGVKGFRVSRSATGRVRTTASIPGTGISYVQERSAPMKEKTRTGKKRRWIWAVVAAVLVIGAWGSRSGGSSAPAAASPTPTVEQVRAIETPVPTPRPSVAPTPAPTPRPSVEPTPEPTRSYVINKNSHLFHYEWCSAVSKMSEKNRVPFEGTRSELLEQGYDPCDICKP